MKFPLYDTEAYEPNSELYKALGISSALNARYASALDMLVLEVSDKNAITAINPDYSGLIKSSDHLKELVITAKSDDTEYDFYSRCFCPWIGINEDPVTGASHSVLAKYWSKILNKTEMLAYQSSKRGGYIHLKIINETELEVTSQAHIALEGNIHI